MKMQWNHLTVFYLKKSDFFCLFTLIFSVIRGSIVVIMCFFMSRDKEPVKLERWRIIADEGLMKIKSFPHFFHGHYCAPHVRYVVWVWAELIIDFNIWKYPNSAFMFSRVFVRLQTVQWIPDFDFTVSSWKTVIKKHPKSLNISAIFIFPFCFHRRTIKTL